MSKKQDGEMGARADKKVGKKASSGVNVKENVHREKPKVGARGDVRREKPGVSAKGGACGEKMQNAQKKREILKLVVLLVISVAVPILFVGAAAGWFNGDGRVAMDASDYCEKCGEQMVDISGEEYEKMVKDGRSFMVFVDQENCTTADKVEGFIHNFADEKDLRVYRIQFSEAKETSMHEKVKYYPSVVVVNRGNIAGFLRADSDEDARAYNDEGEFRGWVERYVK